MLKTISVLIFFIGLQAPIWAQMVGTPYFPAVSGDRIRASLTTAGAAYDAAASNTLVEISLTEYNAILANVTGAAKKGYMGNMAGALNSFGILGGTNNASTGTVDLLSANSYVVAAAYQTYSATTAHIQITAAASPSSAVTCLTSTTTAIAWAAKVTKYFAVKKPTTNSGTNTYVGHLPNGTIYGTYAIASVGCYYNISACGGASSNSYPYAIGLQVVATTTKSW
jgi:hypothetical protein